MWFHKYLSSRGYCNPKIPKLSKRIKKDGKIFFYYFIRSYTFNSLDWIHQLFYKDGQKILPLNILDYFSPFVLAIWFMNDGSSTKSGILFVLRILLYKKLNIFLLFFIKNIIFKLRFIKKIKIIEFIFVKIQKKNLKI
jgi:hypothetical protein